MEEKRVILAIDLKSFYASVECIDRGLDPFNTPLVVADTSRGKGTIIMAVTPYLKTLGIPSRLRLFDLPQVDNMIYARPRMERYIKKSVEVISIYLNYVSENDIHVYSIDEAFLDVTNYLHSSGKDKIEFAKTIIQEVYDKTGLRVTAGIGENLLMAKVAMDVEAKHKKDFLASWTKDDIPNKLWPLKPLSKMWGIGSHLEKRLNDLGLYSVGDVALADKKLLKEKLGVIGEETWEHANGIDNSRIQEKYIPDSSSLSIGQTLFADYNEEETKLLITEMTDELIVRLKTKKVLTSSLMLWCGYSDHKGGFGKAVKLANATDSYSLIHEVLIGIFEKNFDKNATVRNIGIVGSDLISNNYFQPSLFYDEQKEEKIKQFELVMANIKGTFGLDSIVRCSALMEKSNAIRRFNQIGGHRR